MKKGDVLICPVCGSEFMAKSFNHKYCSVKCSDSILLQAKENKDRSHFSIFERDSFTCCYCGKSSIEHQIQLELEHIIPRISGGNNSLYNVVTSCHTCNARKNTKQLTKEVFLRILKRNIELNKGISIVKRNEIREGLVNRFPDTNENIGLSRIIDQYYGK